MAVNNLGVHMKTKKTQTIKDIDSSEIPSVDLPTNDTVRFILDVYTLGVTVPRGFVVSSKNLPSYFTAGVHYELGSQLVEELHQAISVEQREILMKVLGG
jgi:hypothetical protein